MLLSVCMIVKNEALTLERCLLSLQGVADEIIVVDTGSTDNTVEIAESFGAKIFSFAWDNDFSHARNESLRHAQGKWILVIDADEYLDEQKKQGFRQFLETSNAEGIFVNVRNYLGSLQRIVQAMPIRVLRVFRSGNQYSGAIHEQIAESIQKTGRPIIAFDLDLHHIGYTDEFITQRGKSKRNTPMIEQELENDPGNLFHRSNLMAEHVIEKRYQAGERLAEDTISIIRQQPRETWPNFIPRIFMHWITCLWEQGKRASALKQAEFAISEFPWLTDFKKHYGTMLAEEGYLRKAESVLMACRAQGDTKEGLIEFAEGMGTYLAAQDLGVIWSRLGDDMVARKWYLQAFLENPTLEMSVTVLVLLMPPDAEFLQEHIESRLVDEVTSIAYAEMYAVRGLPGANQVIERVEKRYGTTVDIERARTACVSRLGTEALESYVREKSTENHWLWLGLHYLENGRTMNAETALSKAGIKGSYISKAHELFSATDESHWNIVLVLKDMLAMNTERLLRKWLPFTVDIQTAWLVLKYSPLGHLLSEVSWPGDNVYECEQNALRCFRQREWGKASEWLKKSKAFELTVTQILLACDIALAQNDVATARKAIYEGKKVFPQSEAIKNASQMIHPQVNPVELHRDLISKNKERVSLQ